MECSRRDSNPNSFWHVSDVTAHTRASPRSSTRATKEPAITAGSSPPPAFRIAIATPSLFELPNSGASWSSASAVTAPASLSCRNVRNRRQGVGVDRTEDSKRVECVLIGEGIAASEQRRALCGSHPPRRCCGGPDARVNGRGDMAAAMSLLRLSVARDSSAPPVPESAWDFSAPVHTQPGGSVGVKCPGSMKVADSLGRRNDTHGKRPIEP